MANQMAGWDSWCRDDRERLEEGYGVRVHELGPGSQASSPVVFHASRGRAEKEWKVGIGLDSAQTSLTLPLVGSVLK